MFKLSELQRLRRRTRRRIEIGTAPEPKQETGAGQKNTCPCGRYRLGGIPVLNWASPSVFVEGLWRMENLGAVTSAEMALWSLGVQSTCTDSDCPAFSEGERRGPSIVPTSDDATAKSSEGDLVG